MKIAIALLSALPLVAQTIPVGLSVPEKLVLQVNIAGSTASNPTVLYTEILVPATASLAKAEILSVPHAESKCATSAGVTRCVVAGATLDPIAPGGAVRLTYQIAAGPACIPVARMRIAQGVAPGGTPTAMSWSEYSVRMDPAPSEDLTADGKVDVEDLRLAIMRLVTATPGSSIAQVITVLRYLSVGECPFP